MVPSLVVVEASYSSSNKQVHTSIVAVEEVVGIDSVE